MCLQISYHYKRIFHRNNTPNRRTWQMGSNLALPDFGAYGGLWGGVLLLALGVPFILHRKERL